MQIDFNIEGLPFDQYYTTDFNGTEVLTEAEKKCIGHAAPQRVNHFSTGRFCAREAMKSLGLTGTEILVGNGKEPLWPAAVIGSISHSKKMAGAVVASADKLLAIGMDIETIGGVRPDMWDMLFLPSEQQYLSSYQSDELMLQTTILFSGKEAFYKFQYPLTKTFLDFTDVAMAPDCGKFKLKLIKEFANKASLPSSITIHTALHHDQVITVCYLEKETRFWA